MAPRKSCKIPAKFVANFPAPPHQKENSLTRFCRHAGRIFLWEQVPRKILREINPRHFCRLFGPTYHAIPVRSPMQVRAKELCDTIATSIARYKNFKSIWGGASAERNCSKRNVVQQQRKNGRKRRRKCLSHFSSLRVHSKGIMQHL